MILLYHFLAPKEKKIFAQVYDFTQTYAKYFA